MSGSKYSPGDQVVFCMLKCSPRPGPRARNVIPSPRGEAYEYRVDKYWVVAESRDDGTVLLMTRRGKMHSLRSNNPNLRPASFWERIRYASRFPQLQNFVGTS